MVMVAMGYRFEDWRQFEPTQRIQVVQVRRRSSGFIHVLLMFASLGSALFIMSREPEYFVEKYYSLRDWARGVRMNWTDEIDNERARRSVEVNPKFKDAVTTTPVERAPTQTSRIYRDPRPFIPYDNGIEELPKRIGNTVTIKAVVFDKRQVQNCEVKCTVDFFDHFGRRVRGVFFKAAHAQKLMASYGKVTITGLVKKTQDNDYVLFIQRVL